MRWISVGGQPARRAHSLLEHDERSGSKEGAHLVAVIAKGGVRRAPGNAALKIAPGVEMQLVVGRVRREVVHGLEDLRTDGQRVDEELGIERRPDGDLRDELRTRW